MIKLSLQFQGNQLYYTAMLTSKFFPTLLILLDLCAAAGYAYTGTGDWRKIVYWISAAVLTACVTY